jgi:hypothetical protein
MRYLVYIILDWILFLTHPNLAEIKDFIVVINKLLMNQFNSLHFVNLINQFEINIFDSLN